MKHIFTVLSVLLITAVASAQSSKQVTWNYSARKIADKTYEVHLTAKINGDWHIYAQNVGVDGPLPTSFSFDKNPLVLIQGKVKESGKLIRKKEDVWNGIVNYYEHSVDFVQVVKLKANIKTKLAGKVEFMVCNDRECLPPSDLTFSVNIGG